MEISIVLSILRSRFIIFNSRISYVSKACADQFSLRSPSEPRGGVIKYLLTYYYNTEQNIGEVIRDIPLLCHKVPSFYNCIFYFVKIFNPSFVKATVCSKCAAAPP